MCFQRVAADPPPGSVPTASQGMHLKSMLQRKDCTGVE
jgi:hypothetical protein